MIWSIREAVYPRAGSSMQWRHFQYSPLAIRAVFHKLKVVEVRFWLAHYFAISQVVTWSNLERFKVLVPSIIIRTWKTVVGMKTLKKSWNLLDNDYLSSTLLSGAPNNSFRSFKVNDWQRYCFKQWQALLDFYYYSRKTETYCHSRYYSNG